MKRSALFLLGLVLTACSALDPDPASLRITNASSMELVELKVFSPGSEVSFGTINPGETSEYRVMPGGVYPYTAFEFTHEGQRVSQPVTDFVGEEPMRGSRFTYTVNMNGAPEPPFLFISSVVRDR